MNAQQAAAPAASIIITNYNYERYVAAAIDSALAQTVPCQVIVVDDGSTDGSLSVIETFGDRIEVLAKENGGQASAFNAGWEAATAPLVFFLDGDDVLSPDAVATMAEAMAATPQSGRGMFRLQWIDAAGAELNGSYPEADRKLPAGDLTDRMISNPDDIAWQPTTGNVFTASLLAELLPMPTDAYRISADHYLSNLSALYGPVVAVERPLGGYRVHGANADHRGEFDLRRAREILVRTEATHAAIIDYGVKRGLAMPSNAEGFNSLTHAALRLVSYRMGDGHPFPSDTAIGTARAALSAAIGRSDFSAARRLGAIGWVVATGLAPRRLVGNLANRALTR